VESTFLNLGFFDLDFDLYFFEVLFGELPGDPPKIDHTASFLLALAALIDPKFPEARNSLYIFIVLIVPLRFSLFALSPRIQEWCKTYFSSEVGLSAGSA